MNAWSCSSVILTFDSAGRNKKGGVTCGTHLIRVLVAYPEVITLVRILIMEFKLWSKWLAPCELENKMSTSHEDAYIDIRA